MAKVQLKSEADLMRLGRMVGPDGKTAEPVEEPTDGWPDDRLLAYAKAKLGEAQQVAEEAISLGRRSPILHFWAGKAYTLLHGKHKGKWKKFQRDHKLVVGTVWEAEQVYKKAVALVPTHGGLPDDKEAAAAILSGRWGDTITAVKSALGITKFVSKATGSPTRQAADVKDEGDSTGDGRPILKFSQCGTSESTGQPEPAGDEDMEESILRDVVLGTLQIGPGVVAKAEADAFRFVSAVDAEQKLLVCRRWDRRAKEAVSRGIAVLVLPELQECRP